ncbi:transposase [Kitasatospora sp. NPDC059795]|uniref:transposase n=1 Tax=Kitasatospora sp. NPDC059795 TaxID=3346949 RepID=UPI0036689B72
MKLRRAIVVLMSAQGQTVKDITVLMRVSEDYVRAVIHAFNEQGLAALDLATGRPYYRIHPRKRWREFLGLLRALRARRPGQKLYVVLDNFSPHKHAKVRTWAADNDVEPVFLPTYGSWPNWIESEFAALRHFALNGTDRRSHDEQNAAVAAYVRRHNTRAEPETNFAPDSAIRSWTDYPARTA